jgi:D-sedoheptulose 7-phosphate isomerase
VSILETGRDHLAALRAALDDFEHGGSVAAEWGAELATLLPHGRRLLACGNGGSAAQAQHLTGEFVGKYDEDRHPYSAVCLSAETSTLTAILNDYPAEELFARQVLAHGRQGDVLVCFSTSGRSANVLAAARAAEEVGVRVWSMTGQAPNPLAEISERVIAVPCSQTGTVQELHLVAMHILCAAFDRAVGAASFPKPRARVAS